MKIFKETLDIAFVLLCWIGIIKFVSEGEVQNAIFLSMLLIYNKIDGKY